MVPDLLKRYKASEEEQTESLLHGRSHRHSLQRPNFIQRYWFYLTHGVLLVLWLTFMILWMRTRHSSVFTPRPFSPANEAVEYYKEYQRFNGTLNFTSIYRGEPSPELDAAWIRVSTGVPPIRISKEQLLMSGEQATPSKVKYRNEDGGGYMAALEVTHQLHCLDILRKSVHIEYYSQIDPLFQAESELYRFHLDHCVDILRQVLMCSADVGLITFEWVQGFNIPYPNFSTKHQCRNLEKVLSWGVSNAAKVPDYRVTRLEGQIDLPQAP